jgi:hypothetical protein
MKLVVLLLSLFILSCQSNRQTKQEKGGVHDPHQAFDEKWDKAIEIAKEDFHAEFRRKLKDDAYVNDFRSANSEYLFSLIVKKHHSSLASYHTSKLIQLIEVHSFLWGKQTAALLNIAETKIPNLYAQMLNGAYQLREKGEKQFRLENPDIPDN